METEEFTQAEVTKWQRWKWTIQDIAGLKIHGFIAWASNDQEVKDLYQEMEKAIMQEGDQPKALQLSEEIKTRVTFNTQERLERLKLT